MTPVRTPDVVRGDVPGLLCRGMPVLAPIHFDDDIASTAVRGIILSVEDDGPYGFDTVGYYDDPRIGRGRYHGAMVTIDWSDRAAIYLCLAWLADRGHICTWMLPSTHGGRVEAWDGLTAWEVSAILVSRSVGRVERGLGPVRDLLSDWRSDCFTYYREPYVGKERVWVYLTDADRMTDIGWALGRPRRGIPSGPETGDAGKLAADRAAIADGCALLAPGGILLPD